MVQLHKLYSPLTAAPFRQSRAYMEIQPCAALVPYVKCFWCCTGDADSTPERTEIVTPDTCLDVIFTVSRAVNRIDGIFCGICDRSFINIVNTLYPVDSVFGIRFYPWASFLFANDSVQTAANVAVDLSVHFPVLYRELRHVLFDVTNIYDRIMITERLLLSQLHTEREQPLLQNAFYEIIHNTVDHDVGHLARHLDVHVRRLERVFLSNTGIAPKKLASLIRYQQVWHDVLFCHKFSIQDEVFAYGYADQSHLLNDFRRFHSMTITQARQYAFCNTK